MSDISFNLDTSPIRGGGQKCEIWPKFVSEARVSKSGIVKIHLNPRGRWRPYFQSLNRNSSAADCPSSQKFGTEFFRVSADTLKCS